jgi:uncharacterized membrane protein
MAARTENDQKENERMARAVGWTLSTGLTISALLLVAGWFLLIVRSQAAAKSSAGAPSLLIRAAHGDGEALLELGLIVLMLTPVARVLVLAIGWLSQRDWTFGLVACCVLGLLALSVILGTG